MRSPDRWERSAVYRGTLASDAAQRHAASCDDLAALIATASPAALPALTAVYDVHASGCGREPWSEELA